MSTPQKGRIFISYRRADSAGYAGRIYDRLTAHFGEDAIFMDVDTIEAGLDFVEVLQQAVQSCDVLLALIGRRWLDSKDPDGKRRLDNPEDFVRIEIAAALERGIRVIPVLVDGVAMPHSTELPENLKPLARRNALQVDHHSFNADANRLIAQLEVALKAAEDSRILKARRLQEEQERKVRQAREAEERKRIERREQEERARLAAEEKKRVEIREKEEERKRKAAEEKIAREKKEAEERVHKAALRRARLQETAGRIKNKFIGERKLPLFIGGGMIGIFLLGYIINSAIAPSTPASPTEISASLPLPSTTTIAEMTTDIPSTPTLLPEPETTLTGAPQELGIGSTMVSDIDGMVMVYIPAGDFWMGRVNGDDDEKPAHLVYLDAFWIYQTEVTNAMYAKCVNDGVCITPSSTRSISRDSYFGNSEFDNYPVVYVSWSNAKTYCEWSGNRLLTEAEWEKAASWNMNNQKKNLYPWGDSIDCSKANYLGKNGYCEGDTTAVGSYISGQSPYGAFDMAGNVWEWVADLYDVYPGGDENASRFFGQSFRVLRGGSWAYADDLARSTDRGWEAPSFTSASFGIRCARDAE